jgi:NAD(P)-dependent dehydrogenase (short-subunit alcohol dehydrogenase family)
VQAVSAATGGTLDYLVNNAGINYVTPTLDISISKAKEVFSANFWGTVEVVQASAPLLIKAKDGGTVVNTSSILSLLNMPFQGIYCASKAAVSMFDDVLRVEMKPLGVRVVTVITGSVGSNINNEGSGFEGKENSRYREIEGRIRHLAYGKEIPNQMKSEVYAERVVSDVPGSAKGKIWRGGNATLVRCLDKMPQGVMVGCPPLKIGCCADVTEDSVVLKGSGLDELGKTKK